MKTKKISVSNVFRFLTGDVNYLDYGGKWYRKVATNRYHIIELTNMWEATGDKSTDKYCVTLVEVDITSSRLEEALKSCGPEEEYRENELVKVDALSSYGAKAHLSRWDGGNANKLLIDARAESRMLASNPDAYEEAMSRPVNALGSTAREYADGDISSAIARGVRLGNANAKIMAKLHGMEEHNTIMFGTLNQDGSLTNVRNICREDVVRCKFSILVPEHYREDGSCKCNNREHRAMMIREWEYKISDFEGIPLID